MGKSLKSSEAWPKEHDRVLKLSSSVTSAEALSIISDIIEGWLSKSNTVIHPRTLEWHKDT